MKNKKIILKGVLILTMIFSNISFVYADNKQDETIGIAEFIDENGNITEVEVQDGTTGEGETEENNSMARTVSTANMVNFNCSKSGITTSYTDYYTNQSGYLSKANGADAAFLGYVDGKVKFMMSGVVGLVDSSYVEVLNKGTYYASNYEVNSKGKLYHYISTNVKATGNSSGQSANFNYVGQAPEYLKKGVEYYSYDGHYFYTNYDVMINDYKKNRRTQSVNPNNPYYNYFQYLPLRSKTNYTGGELNNYLSSKNAGSKLLDTGDLFIKYQNKYGVNALMATAFAILESGWGKSSIATNKNNLFGLDAVDGNPGANADSFNSVDACIMNFTSSWMSKRYLNANYTNRFRGGYFGDLGSGIFVDYSSDPYEGEKVAALASNIDLGISSKDKNYYTIGIKDATLTTHTILDVRSESNLNSNIYYQTIKNTAYAFLIRNKTLQNNFYQIQSDCALTSNRNSVSSNAEYDFDKSYAYILNDSITLINTGIDIKEIQPTSVKLNATSKTIQKGKTYTLVATIIPTNATNKKVTYTTSNSKVATVTSNGTVKAVNYGTAVITVKTSNKKTATCKVTVPYTVKYNLNGGTNNKANPTSYYGKKITLQNPTRKGYSFAGWYSDSKYKTKVTSFTSGNKVLYAKWNKVTVSKAKTPTLTNIATRKLKVSYGTTSGVKGYQIQYATNSKFTGSKTKTTSSRNYTITSLTKGKRYYVRVRGYKTDSTGNKVYGTWSAVKNIKISK